jgi:hypothetical protein
MTAAAERKGGVIIDLVKILRARRLTVWVYPGNDCFIIEEP